MSFEKFFRGRPVDLHGYIRSFPDRAAAYFRASGMTASEIAVSYGVSERTAQNWLEGISRPSGPTMALVAMRDPDGFQAHFTPGGERAA